MREDELLEAEKLVWKTLWHQGEKYSVAEKVVMVVRMLVVMVVVMVMVVMVMVAMRMVVIRWGGKDRGDGGKPSTEAEQ